MKAPFHQYQRSRSGGNTSTEVPLEYLGGIRNGGPCAHRQTREVVFRRWASPGRCLSIKCIGERCREQYLWGTGGGRQRETEQPSQEGLS